MGENIQLACLYDAQGHRITEWHPGFEARKRAIQFESGGYNPRPERRGKAPSLSQTGKETWASDRDRLKAMADARDLAAHDWIGGVIGRVVLYVAGSIQCKSNTGDGEIDQAYDQYFYDWCGDQPGGDFGTRCDLSGRHRFSKLVQMAFAEFLVDGDCGFLEIAADASPMAQFSPAGEYIPGTGDFCLQAIQADRIGSPNDATTSEDYIGGIGIDPATGRVKFYRVFHRTRTSQYTKLGEFTPDQFIHVFDPEWADEYRGRTKLLRLLNDARDIREWIEAEKIAGKTQSQWAAWVSTKDPFNNNGPGAWTDKTAEGTPVQDALWGKILKGGEGESISMLAPAARPSGNFMAFVQMIVRKMAMSLGLSYEFLWDLSLLGGVQARISLQSDLRRIQFWQQNVLISKILNRVRRKVIAQGIATKAIPAIPNWQADPEWHFGPWITTDAGYEMRNDIEGVQTGILPVSEVFAKYGKSPREGFEANAKAANDALSVGAQFGLPVETFAAGLYPNITNQKAAFDTPTPQPPPPPGSIEALGDKGVDKLTEILIAVGEGKMDRESGINAVMTMFGLPRAQADKIVPDEPKKEDLAAKESGEVKEMRSRLDLIQFSNMTNSKPTQPQSPVNVHMPEVKIPEIRIPQPVFNVTVPDQVAPIVNVTVPQQPAPVVHVAAPRSPIVNVAAPIVNVAAPDVNLSPVIRVAQQPITVKAPDVNVTVQPADVKIPKPVKEHQTVSRDQLGNITGSTTEYAYAKEGA